MDLTPARAVLQTMAIRPPLQPHRLPHPRRLVSMIFATNPERHARLASALPIRTVLMDIIAMTLMTHSTTLAPTMIALLLPRRPLLPVALRVVSLLTAQEAFLVVMMGATILMRATCAVLMDVSSNSFG